MRFRKKVFIIILGGLFVMIASLLALSRVAYGLTLDSIARQDVLHTYEHATALILGDLEHLRIINADWSIWDDAYEYAELRNSSFETSNLQESTFKTLKLSSFSIFDRNGRLVFAFPAGSVAKTDSSPLASLRSEALRNGSAAGVLEMNGAYVYAAAHGILRSDGSGPAVGTLVMTRAADRDALAFIVSVLDADISLEKPNGEGSVNTPRIVVADDGSYEAIGEIPSVSPGESILIRVHPEKRAIHFNGLMFFGFILIGVLITLTVTGFIFLLLDRYLIRRIDRIGHEIETLSVSGESLFRVTVDGNDEISRLGTALNATFDSLEKSIAENKRAMLSLEKSFAERESLFQEIRHRVKNNLQVVASLLNLQADEAKSESLSEAFHNSRRRVLAIAFVHEELYISDSLNSINLHEYLERLSIQIRQALDLDNCIRFELDAESLELSVEKAVPFALICNEVLSNAYVHAFCEDHSGTDPERTVSLSLHTDTDGSYDLRVLDNGKGIAPISTYKGTLGLTLIDVLSAQLDARYSYVARPEGGSAFRLSFAKERSNG